MYNLNAKATPFIYQTADLDHYRQPMCPLELDQQTIVYSTFTWPWIGLWILATQFPVTLFSSSSTSSPRCYSQC